MLEDEVRTQLDLDSDIATVLPPSRFEDNANSNLTCRYTLNIKGIPYKTVWVEYPDIAPLCQKVDIPKSDPLAKAPFTLPAIYDPNTKTAVSDSGAIVRYLDRTYPNAGPTLVPEELDALHRAFDAAFNAAIFGGCDLGPISAAGMCAELPPRSAEYFRRTREVFLGPLEDAAPLGSEKRAKYWKGAEKTFTTIAGWFGTGPDGEEKLRFRGGGEICYADISIAAVLKGLEKAIPADEWQVTVMAWDGGRWARFMAAFRE